MIKLILTLATSTFCFAFQDPSFRSSFNYGSKPILRMGTEDTGNENINEPTGKEPEWVTNLRSNIRNIISEKGMANARMDIQDMIADAVKQEANEGYHIPGDIISFDKITCLNDGLRVRRPVRFELAQLRKGRPEPEWVEDLKSYIAKLIKEYDHSQLDGIIRPIISSIEKTENVIIDGIDVNPYGFSFQHRRMMRNA